jgi:hypothetical protein
MDMLGHDDEPDAQSIVGCQLRPKSADHDLLGAVVIEKFAAFIAQERNELGVPFVVVNALFFRHEIS